MGSSEAHVAITASTGFATTYARICGRVLFAGYWGLYWGNGRNAPFGFWRQYTHIAYRNSDDNDMLNLRMSLSLTKYLWTPFLQLLCIIWKHTPNPLAINSRFSKSCWQPTLTRHSHYLNQLCPFQVHVHYDASHRQNSPMCCALDQPHVIWLFYKYCFQRQAYVQLPFSTGLAKACISITIRKSFQY